MNNLGLTKWGPTHMNNLGLSKWGPTHMKPGTV